MVPLSEEYYGYLYDLLVIGPLSARWGYNHVPTREAFLNEISSGVFCQFIIFDRESAKPIGLARAYQANSRNGTLWMGGIVEPESHGKRAGLEALFLFVNYLISTWPIRKIYMDVPEFNLDQFSSGLRRIWHEEGRLIDDVYYGGVYWDRITLALYTEDLSERRVFQHVVRVAEAISSESLRAAEK